MMRLLFDYLVSFLLMSKFYFYKLSVRVQCNLCSRSIFSVTICVDFCQMPELRTLSSKLKGNPHLEVMEHTMNVMTTKSLLEKYLFSPQFKG